MLWCRLLNKQQHLYPHISKFIKIMLVMLTSLSKVEDTTVYAECQTQPGFNCQMQSSSVMKYHT